MKNLLLLTLYLSLAPAALTAGRMAASQVSPARSERISFNAGWRFQKDDPAGTGDALSYNKLRDWLLPIGNELVAPEQRKTAPAGNPGEGISYTQPEFDDSQWRQLNLPHDWGIEGPFDQSLPGETGKLPWFGVAWYRKSFDLPTTDAGRQIALEIDGAMSYAEVWCNGKFVGGWPYGYASFRLDLTPFVKAGGRNVIAIRLDNPKDSSRWYPGGGIYRNVWLSKTPAVHLAHWGTVVDARTPELAVQTTLRNDSSVEATATLTTSILEADGKLKVSGTPVKITLAPGQEQFVRQKIPMARGSALARLWSLEDPYLYRLVSTVTSSGGVDTSETLFGIRSIEFTVGNGFLLNKKRVQLHGVCLHHDLGALGSAINTRALERQLEILREMGVNAIRTSHNPPAPELLDLCDRLGFLVMDEFVDTWKRPKKPNGYGKLFDDWSELDLRTLVRRDRNHPSVILWSLGNEISEQGAKEGPEMQKRLAQFVHEEDATRQRTMAVSDVRAGYNGFQTGLDVFGFNYKPGEYRKFREANPTIPLFGSETSSTVSSRGEYFYPVSNNKAEGKSDFQVSSYDLYAPGWATTPDAEFKGQEENPFVAGEFVWTGFDYLGEPTPYGNDSMNLLNYHTPEAKAAAEKELQELGKIKVPSRSSYFGIVDLAGFKKDRFYLYQSHWRPDLPMAHILPHWNWAGREGEITPVHVYTSGDEAELFLNGRSLGRKKKGSFEYRLRWDEVKYAPGELKVVTYKGGKHWADAVMKTTGPAAKLSLAADRAKIRADGADLSFVTVTIVDKDGQVVPHSKNMVRFELSGPGEIVATDNGDATSFESFQAKDRSAYNGLALVVVRSKAGQAGALTLTAQTEGLTPATLRITSQ